MNKDVTITERVAREFTDLVQSIQEAKIKNKTANIKRRETFSVRRITLAIIRHPAFIERVVPDIINADLDTEGRK